MTVNTTNPTLPHKDSPDIFLVEGSPEELRAQQEAHSVEWGGPLSKEAYLRREHLLWNQEFTKDGALTQWILAYQPPGAATRQTLCGCESLKKPALIRRNGKVEDAIAYGIASVFCPVDLRGRGYAGRMMSEVGKRLKSWHPEEGKEIAFSVLFSDIGKDFYTARGWMPFPSAHVSLPVTKSPPAQLLPTPRMLKAEDLAELCTIDEKLLRSRMTSLDTSQTPVALLPDVRTLVWHHAREQFVANEVYKKQPVVKGAVVGEPGSRVWCCWTRVWTNPNEDAPNTLHILRLVVEDETFADFTPATMEGVSRVRDTAMVKAIAALFAAAQAEGAAWDMKEVTLWNPNSISVAAAELLHSDAEIEHREKESITSLLWYGEGTHRDVEWLCNEKYGWC